MISLRRRNVFAACLSAFLLHPPSLLLAQPPSLINYQGRLVDGTNLVNGLVGLTLRLFDSPAGGTLLYEDSNTVTVVDGLYDTALGDNTVAGDLSDSLNATELWIEVVVNNVPLSPRERVQSVAYALRSASVASGAIDTAALADGAVTGSKLAGASVSNVHLAAGAVTANTIQDGTILPEDMNLGSFQGSFWQTGGNAGLVPGGSFLGTTDGAPLDFRVNNQRALRLQSTDTLFSTLTPNLIGGSSANVVRVNGLFPNNFLAVGAAVGGGGNNANPNIVADDYGVVAGGFGNIAGSDDGFSNNPGAVVGGGASNRASGSFSVVPGGSNNQASGFASFAAGSGARAVHANSFVWADGQPGTFTSSTSNQFLIRAQNGLAINATPIGTETLHVRGPLVRLYHPTQSFGAGTKLLFGDQERVRLEEDEDDKLLIHGHTRTAIMGGNVGINTNAPSQRLHVNGNLRVDGNVIVSGSVSSGAETWMSIPPVEFRPVGVKSYYCWNTAIPQGCEGASDLMAVTGNKIGFSIYAENWNVLPSELYVWAPVQLPHGATLHECRVRVNHPAGTRLITFNESQSGTNSKFVFLSDLNPSGTPPQTYTLTFSPPWVIDNSAKTYSLLVSLGTPSTSAVMNTAVYGAFLRYTPP
jgi:hypothetical protein